MKNPLPQKRIKVYSFLKTNQPKSYTAKQIERATGIKLQELKGIIRDLLNLGRIRIERQEPGPTPGSLEYYYQAIPGQMDITPLIGDLGKKPGRKTTTTQATAWEAVERDPKRFSQIEKVYSFLMANQNKCFSRRQLEERLKIRVNSMTSILKTLQERNQVGIEKEDACEYTGESVYFYYGIDPKQEPQKRMF
jgi:transcription initiation factor IIE alpha subunit